MRAATKSLSPSSFSRPSRPSPPFGAFALAARPGRVFHEVLTRDLRRGSLCCSCSCDLLSRKSQVDYLVEVAKVALRSLLATRHTVHDVPKLVDAFETTTDLIARLAEACSLVSSMSTLEAEMGKRLTQFFNDANDLNDAWATACNVYADAASAKRARTAGLTWPAADPREPAAGGMVGTGTCPRQRRTRKSCARGSTSSTVPSMCVRSARECALRASFPLTVQPALCRLGRLLTQNLEAVINDILNQATSMRFALEHADYNETFKQALADVEVGAGDRHPAGASGAASSRRCPSSRPWSPAHPSPAASLSGPRAILVRFPRPLAAGARGSVRRHARVADRGGARTRRSTSAGARRGHEQHQVAGHLQDPGHAHRHPRYAPRAHSSQYGAYT